MARMEDLEAKFVANNGFGSSEDLAKYNIYLAALYPDAYCKGLYNKTQDGPTAYELRQRDLNKS